MACAEQDPPLVTAAPPPQAAPVDPLPASRPPLPDLGLIPLPTVEEVQRSAPAGRPDPFQPLPPIMAAGVDDADAEGGAAAVMDPMTGLMLSGLMQVGERSRALVKHPPVVGPCAWVRMVAVMTTRSRCCLPSGRCCRSMSIRDALFWRGKVSLKSRSVSAEGGPTGGHQTVQVVGVGFRIHPAELGAATGAGLGADGDQLQS